MEFLFSRPSLSKKWTKGKHKHGVRAGNELTYTILKISPHGLKKLKKVKPVGFLAFTPSELSKYNGKKNIPYVAVNGIVYDVSHSKAWKNGNHKKGIKAGKILTYEIKNISPHGVSKLKNVYNIGLLVFSKEELKKYNGKELPAYVMVNNIIYDVSHLPKWKGGIHAEGKHRAGKDLTNEIENLSPHGLGMLKKAEIVGFWIK